MPKSIIGLQGCPQRMDPGALGAPVKEFTSQLLELGYSQLTVTGYKDSARHFGQWLQRMGIAVADIDEDVVLRFARHRCRCPGARKHSRLSGKYVKRVRRFISFLVDRGAVAPPVPDVSMPRDDRVAAYQEWLKQHRGFSERTINGHSRMIMRLLPALGNDPGTYDAGLVRSVILAEAKCASRAYVKKMTTALRGYLRFLAACGACRPGLDQAIPTIPQWRLSTLPLYLLKNDVELVIASCDLTKTHGVRDQAVLLLLARLGLRAGDILDMRINDVAWAEGTLRVRGKGRREIRLPLPQEVGNALFDYLQGGRPRVASDRIFLTSVAPYRPFGNSSAVSGIVRLALKRARIVDPPSHGAHLLRHSAATGMLRAGATLDAIGTLLHHRSVDTTAHYAKVDVNMLRQIAQPWPGDASC